MAKLIPIVIERFSNMKPSGLLWLEGFFHEIVNRKSLLTVGGQIDNLNQKGDANLTNLGLITAYCERNYSSTNYVYAIDSPGYIYRGPATTCSLAQLRDITTTPCTHGDIKPFTISGTETLLYTSAQYLGKTTDDSSFTDNAEDFGAAQVGWYRQIEIFLDIAWFGNGNYLASLSNVGVFAASDKQLPNGYNFRCMAANGDYMLISATKNGKGVLLLFDGVVANAWVSIKERDNIVTSIRPYKNGWVFTEGPKLYRTDGFNVREIPDGVLPDAENNLSDLSIGPYGLLISGNKILVGASGGVEATVRTKSGVWCHDLIDQSWRFFPLPVTSTGRAYYGSTIGAMYFSTVINRFLVGYEATIVSNPFFNSILSFQSRSGQNTATMLLSIPLEKKVSLEYLVINFLSNIRGYEVSSSPTLAVTLRIGDGKRPFWAYGQSNAAQAVKDKIQVDGTVSTYNAAEVGDEVLILEGLNGGNRREITEIADEGEATEAYTLDSDMNENIEDTVMFNILPLEKIETKELTDFTKNRLYFDLSDKIVSGRILIEITISHTYFPISLSSIILQPSEVVEEPNEALS